MLFLRFEYFLHIYLYNINSKNKPVIDRIYKMESHKMHDILIKNGQKQKKASIEDNIFNIAIRKGLIEEINGDFIFIGDYSELLAFQRKKDIKTYDWLD